MSFKVYKTPSVFQCGRTHGRGEFNCICCKRTRKQMLNIKITAKAIKVNYSFLTPRNDYLTHKNIVLYSSYLFRCHLRLPLGALQQNLKLTKI
jgi:hypothetical protein